ncbi:MAG: purine-nucleoside phosphorylase [Bacilli bacterium]|nr:purine-nucleoside phosphorylase [Bacilli bacterium]
MATVHNEANKGDIAKIVIMPGDPLRAKYIAETYLENVKLVNKIRNLYAYTGTYKNKEVTVMASGMGIPSMGIYSYELYKFYDVEEIIRIGTCGSFNKDIKIRDIILSQGAYSKTYFPKLLDNEMVDYVESDKELNEKIINTSKEKNINIKYGKTITSDVFDVYVDNKEEFENNYSDEYLSVEMEAFALFYVAKKFNKKASCLMTVVDSKYDTNVISSEERQTSLDEMITLALDSIL